MHRAKGRGIVQAGGNIGKVTLMHRVFRIPAEDIKQLQFLQITLVTVTLVLTLITMHRQHDLQERIDAAMAANDRLAELVQKDLAHHRQEELIAKQLAYFQQLRSGKTAPAATP